MKELPPLLPRNTEKDEGSERKRKKRKKKRKRSCPEERKEVFLGEEGSPPGHSSWKRGEENQDFFI